MTYCLQSLIYKICKKLKVLICPQEHTYQKYICHLKVKNMWSQSSLLNVFLTDICFMMKNAIWILYALIIFLMESWLRSIYSWGQDAVFLIWIPMLKIRLYRHCLTFNMGIPLHGNLDSNVHGANMGPNWVLSAPGGSHVGPMNLVIWEDGLYIETGLCSSWWHQDMEMLFSLLVCQRNPPVKGGSALMLLRGW